MGWCIWCCCCCCCKYWLIDCDEIWPFLSLSPSLKVCFQSNICVTWGDIAKKATLMAMIDHCVVIIVVSVLIIDVYCIYLLTLAEWKYDLIHLKTFPTALITASKCAFCDKSVQRTAPFLYIMMKQQIIKGGSPITDYHVHIFVGHDHQWRNEWKIDILVYY